MKVDYAYTEELDSLTYDRFDSWVKSGKAGVLKYLVDERKEKRKSLREFWDKTEAALVFRFFYDRYNKNISSFALGFDGHDYHQVVAEYLMNFSKDFDQEVKVVVDTSPILERDLAYRAGLGWFGKNSMLLSKEGSYFMIGAVLLSKKMSYQFKKIQSDHCGSCTKCIDSCPTSAIDGDKREVDASKCLSTYTIEIFKPTTFPKGHEKANNLIFGCDICQEVCPWNHRVPLATSSDNSVSSLLTKSQSELISWLESMSNREFVRQMRGTPLERTGRVGILKNLKKSL